MTSTPIERAQRRLKLIERRDSQIATLKKRRQKYRALRALVKKDGERIQTLLDQRAVLKTTLRAAVREFEASIIAETLRQTEGKMSPAALRLGTSRQNLESLLAGRHKSLAHLRTAKIPRRATAPTRRTRQLCN